MSSINTNSYGDPNANYNIIHNHLTYFKNKHPPFKFVKFNRYKHKGNKWMTAGVLRNSNIMSSVNTNSYGDPNANYNIIHNHLTYFKNKHPPFKFVKFNTYKHKGNKWITAGVLRSIKYRDKLYKALQNTDRTSHLYFFPFKQKLNKYNSLLK